jgi:hypothetical protein
MKAPPAARGSRSAVGPMMGAYAVAIGITVLGYYALKAFGIAEVHAATIPSSVAFLNIGPLNRAFRRGTIREVVVRDWLALPDRVVAPASYVLEWPQAIGLGAGWLFAAINIATLAGSLAVEWLGHGPVAAIGGALGATVVVGALASFILGRWIGTRTWELAVPAVVAAVLIGRVGAALAAFLLFPDVVAGAQSGVALDDPRWWAITVAWLALALLGLWRGRRLRSSAYVAFLASTLVPGSREALVELAYQEAQILETESERRAAADGRRRGAWWHRDLW